MPNNLNVIECENSIKTGSTQRSILEQHKTSPPPTVESCSDNSIAFWREAPSTTEKTATESCGDCTPCAWSLFELAELLDELDWRLLWLAGVLCCSNDSSIALMKSISISSSFSGWLLRWRPELVWKITLDQKPRPSLPLSPSQPLALKSRNALRRRSRNAPWTGTAAWFRYELRRRLPLSWQSKLFSREQSKSKKQNKTNQTKSFWLVIYFMGMNHLYVKIKNESYWAVLSCGTVYYAVQGGSNFKVGGWNPSVRPFKMKAIEQYFHVVLFIMLYKVVLTLKSVDETLVCDHSKWKLLSSTSM